MSELIYGRHAVLETLRAARRHVYRLWLEGDNQAKPGDILFEIQRVARESQTPVRSIQRGIFEKLAQQNVNAQGVALEVGDYPYVEADDILDIAKERSEPPLLLILDHLQDPQNLGTLIRTAEAMGVHGVVIPERRSARITAAVTNSSAGAVEHMAVAQVTNINRLIDELKELNIWVAGLDSTEESAFLNPKMLDGALAVVVGNEGSGLSRLTREKCDFLVRLRMYGTIDSLNAAVAGSIVLYLARQARHSA